jgi:hypothetical protein
MNLQRQILKGIEPYRVQSILQSPLSRPTKDEILYNHELLFIPALKSAWVVENVTVVAWKDEFVLDVMFATLRK